MSVNWPRSGQARRTEDHQGPHLGPHPTWPRTRLADASVPLDQLPAERPDAATVPAVWMEDSCPAMPACRARAYAPGRAASSASTSASVDGWPRRETLGTPGSFLVQAHGQEHVRRARNTGGAGGARGRFDAGEVQEEEQGITFAAGEGEVRVAGQAARPRALRAARPPGRLPHARRSAGPGGPRSGRTPPGGCWRRLRPPRQRRRWTRCPACRNGRPVPGRRRAAPESASRRVPGECTDAYRAADLVAGNGHRVQPGRPEVHGHRAEGLDGIGVDRHTGRVGQLDNPAGRAGCCPPRCWPT